MSDIEDIKQVLARYWVFLDDRREAEWLDLFAEGATMVFGEHRVDTRAELETLAASFKNYPGGKHLGSNDVIDITGDRAQARSDVVFLGRGEGRQVITEYYGRCDDDLVRTPAGWKLASRVITFEGGHHD